MFLSQYFFFNVGKRQNDTPSMWGQFLFLFVIFQCCCRRKPTPKNQQHVWNCFYTPLGKCDKIWCIPSWMNYLVCWCSLVRHCTEQMKAGNTDWMLNKGLGQFWLKPLMLSWIGLWSFCVTLHCVCHWASVLVLGYHKGMSNSGTRASYAQGSLAPTQNKSGWKGLTS